VVVSTDSEEIAALAQSHGGIVRALRPAELAGDLSSSESAIEHARRHMCRQPLTDHFIFPQVTSPCRRPGLFDRAYGQFRSQEYESLFSSTMVRNFLWRGKDRPVPQYDPTRRPMRQQIQTADLFFRENGNFYICDTARFLESGCRVFGRIGMFEISEEEALEIDDASDLDELSRVMARSSGGAQA